MRLKLEEGQRVKILNLDKLFHPDVDNEEYNYWKQILGKTGVATGDFDETYYRDDAYFDHQDADYDDDSDYEDHRTQEYSYCINLVNPADGSLTELYMFKHNFEVLKLEPPKDDIEWMDRVQQNFKF